MNKFEDMSQEDVERVVTRTYKEVVLRNDRELIRVDTTQKLYAISREWFKNLSTGHISPISNETRNNIFICSKALNELYSTGVYYRIDTND